MKKNRTVSILAFSWFILTVILLTLPGTVLPKENWLDKIWADKWVHIFLFGVLVVVWCQFFYKLDLGKTRLKRIFWGVLLSGIVYGIVMELVQKYFIPNRSFDLGDIAADSIGGFIGFFYSARQYIKK